MNARSHCWRGEKPSERWVKGEKVELERLARLRRGMRNPRPGEELVQEYEQRELTRDLIKALDRYVRFHKAAHYTESTEA